MTNYAPLILLTFGAHAWAFGTFAAINGVWHQIENNNIRNFVPNGWLSKGTTCLCDMNKNKTFCHGDNGLTWNLTLWDITNPPNSATFGLFPFEPMPANNDPFHGTLFAQIPVPEIDKEIPARIIFKLRISQVFGNDTRPVSLDLMVNNHLEKSWTQDDTKWFQQYRDVKPVFFYLPAQDNLVSVILKYNVSSNPIFDSAIEFMTADFRLEIWIPSE